MNRVVVLSRETEFSETLCKELREHIDCDVIPSADARLISTDAGVFPRQFIILDADTHPDNLGPFLLNLIHTSPDVNVISLRGSTGATDPSWVAGPGVQEVLSRPLSPSQMKQSAVRIAECIRSFEGAEAIHAKLLRQMKGSRIVAKSRAMREILADLPRLSESDATVLIEGETGTGKDLIARAIHYLGPRSGGPFVTVDCGAIPDSLMENELFGHARGAYTGASGNWGGLIREANGGTMYLDEVEALPVQVQTRFLRLLQEGEYRPLGQTTYQTVNARVIASTNIDLTEVVHRKEFREDLFHRLNVVRVFIPPLRARRADIAALAVHFVQNHARDHAVSPHVPDGILEQWMRCDWPGNVRELENRVQEWLVKGDIEPVLRAASPPPLTTVNLMTLSGIRDEALDRSERSYFREILQRTGGNISRAAKLAHVDRKNLSLLLKKRGIDPAEFRKH
jgi:DNA-binding NtrC family response regulator